MDTLKIEIDHKEAADYIVARVQNFGVRKCVQGNKSKKEQKRRGYLRSVYYNVFGHGLYLQWDIQPEEHWIPPHLVFQVHLSKFSTFKAFQTWAKKVTGKAYPLLYVGKIKRLDCAIDVQMHINDVQAVTYQPRVRNSEQIKSKTKTVYFGTGKKRTRIYEKTLPEKDFDSSNRGSDAPKSGTRIEREFKGNKVLISSLQDVERLKTINPFAQIKTIPKKILVDSSLPHKTKVQIWAFLYRVEEIGLQGARKEFNQSGNFERTIGRHLKGTPGLNLDELWQHRINKFLGKKVKLPAPCSGYSVFSRGPNE